jgi:hypothetical protein
LGAQPETLMNLMNFKGRLSTVAGYLLCGVKFARGVLAFFSEGGRTASFVGAEYPNVGGVMFSSNVGNYVPDCTVASQDNVN